MKKRWVAFLLCAALVQVPALCAGETEFSDVPAGSWFEQGVKTCAERGVMIGTGEGLFSPDAQLSKAECLTLALRLYDLQRGGGGALEKAPEDWGSATFTLADGTVVEGRMEETFFMLSGRKYESAHLCFYLTPEQGEWAKTVDARAATVEFNGRTITGVAQNNNGYTISFYPDWEDEELSQAYHAFCQKGYPKEGEWYRDAVYTMEKWGLDDGDAAPGFWELGRDLGFDRVGLDETCRYQFANALSEAAGELPRLYEVKELPDKERNDYDYGWGNEQLFRLYEAGVLTGSDEYGTFDDMGTLTRAQAAVMVARVLDESQRVQTPPKALPYLSYTLTPVDLQGWEALGSGSGEGADWLPVERYEEAEDRRRKGIFRADGVIFETELEGGWVWGSPAPYAAGDSRYAAVERRRPGSDPAEEELEYGLFDVETGTMAVSYRGYEEYLAAARPLWEGEETEFAPWDGDTSFAAFRDKDGNVVMANFWQGRYYNTDHIPVTPKFQGVSPVNKAGEGFVWTWMNGKWGVCRIRFE